MGFLYSGLVPYPAGRFYNLQKFIEFLNDLEARKIYYKLNKTTSDYIMVEIAVPGERWEVEFSNDDIRIEKFISDGTIFDESEIKTLFDNHTD